MNIKIPELSLVVLIGVSGSGKSTFAAKHFKPTEIISSDKCRGIVSDDEGSLDANSDAFDLVHYTAGKRLKRGLLSVIDATNVQKEARKPLLALAREYHALPVAIVFNIDEKICAGRNEKRKDRDIGRHVTVNQNISLKKSLKALKKEGFNHIFIFKSVEDIENMSISREPLWSNKKTETGPFDIIGDIHGCYDELTELLMNLGYSIYVTDDPENYNIMAQHPGNRKAVFVGDLVDRGPKIPEVLKLVMSMVKSGTALCVQGNHDMKLNKYLNGKNVQFKYGIEESVKQLENETEGFRNDVKEFLYSLISHYVLDQGKLVVSHAGLREDMQGRGSGRVRSFCLFGETTGEIDEYGLPVRYNWAKEYRGKATVVYGHTPVPGPEWLNKTINIDTGCVFGGRLTALRYPEMDIFSVPALKQYYEPVKPVEKHEPELSAQHENDRLLHIDDVTGKRFISTGYKKNITIREENSIAALEVMSRFAVNPGWIIYLPPTMSPSETSGLDDYLEHPEESFRYYKAHGVQTVVCEEKHMGSRAIVIICKNEAAAIDKFGITGNGTGICYTRTGRNFFNDKRVETGFLENVRDGLTKSGFWEKFETDWVCLDCELMPWSVKAIELLKNQYASVAASAINALPDVLESLQEVKDRGIEINGLDQSFTETYDNVKKFRNAYRHYCWKVDNINDLKLAPFHILATEGKTYFGKDHIWHMKNIEYFCKENDIFQMTNYKMIDLNSDDDIQMAIKWWINITSKGGEGMVVKPFNFVEKNKISILQPAIKCRGRDYLRIIYGPDYTVPENLKRLKVRNLSKKRQLAVTEFSLGAEALERFVRKEPLRRVHECVFGVLALESEEVDPRL